MNLAPAPIHTEFSKGVIPDRPWIAWFLDIWNWVLKLPARFDPSFAGVATLASGSAVVPNTSILATTKISLTAQSASANAGFLSVTLSVGVGFTITSSNVLDNRVIFYQMFESL